METNKIYCEDCMETMARMPDGFVDLTVTSPPYDNLRTYNNDIDKTWGEHVWRSVIKELYRVTKEGCVVVWVVGDATINGSETGTSFRQALYFMECGFNLHDTMIYEKPHSGVCGSEKAYVQSFEYMFVFSRGKIKSYNIIKDYISKDAGKIKSVAKRRSDKSGYLIERKQITVPRNTQRKNVWLYVLGLNDKTEHSAVFPEDLAKDHIYSWSNEGDLVYDPFMGSGTTAKMAHIYKRNWIGSEISQEYVDLAYKRLRPYLTQTTLF